MAGRKQTEAGLTGIDPVRLTVPTMDRPSIALSWFLDAMNVEGYDTDERVMLVCGVCGDPVCDIDAGDTLRVLFNTALAHTCTS